MNKHIFITLTAIAALFSVGCQTTNTTATYDQLQKSYSVEYGVILAVEEVVIDDQEVEHGGAFTGAVIGAIEGGDERDATGAVVGAIAGGIIGAIVDDLSKVNGYQLRIKKSNGTEIVVLQRATSLEGIAINDRVEILTDYEGGTVVKRV